MGADLDYSNFPGQGEDTDGGEDVPDAEVITPTPPTAAGSLLDLTMEDGDIGEEEDVEEEAAASNKVTGMVVHALLTAGQNKGPLPERGQQKILNLIHSPEFDPSKVLVKRAMEVKKYIKILVDDDDCVLQELGLDLQEGDPKEWKAKDVAMYGTHALDACVHMVKSTEVCKWMTWEWQGPEGEYSCPLSGERARRRAQQLKAKWEEALGEKVFYVPVTFFSDKTHLNVKGTHKSHPGFLKLCGWKLPFAYTRRAARLIVLLPDLPSIAWDSSSDEGSKFKSATAWKAYIKMRKQDLHHAALAAVLTTLKEHSRYYYCSNYVTNRMIGAT